MTEVKMMYGIELEFFVKESSSSTFIPAFEVTNNLDGNPIVGELRTKVHDNILDCIFELNKLIFKESRALEAKGYTLVLTPIMELSPKIYKALLKNREYHNRKSYSGLTELSIYNNDILETEEYYELLDRNVFKASLQLNMSARTYFNYTKYNEISIGKKSKIETESKKIYYNEVFDYISIIRYLDNLFKVEIKDAKRIAGIYAIKKGEYGQRIEYRSLPNNISLDTLLRTTIHM